MKSIKESLQNALNEARSKVDDALMKKGMSILDKLGKKYTGGSAGVFWDCIGDEYDYHIDELAEGNYIEQDEADVLKEILGSYNQYCPLDSVVFMELHDVNDDPDEAETWPDENWKKKGSNWVMKFNDGNMWFGEVELKKLDPASVEFFKAMWDALVH